MMYCALVLLFLFLFAFASGCSEVLQAWNGCLNQVGYWERLYCTQECHAWPPIGLPSLGRPMVPVVPCLHPKCSEQTLPSASPSSAPSASPSASPSATPSSSPTFTPCDEYARDLCLTTIVDCPRCSCWSKAEEFRECLTTLSTADYQSFMEKAGFVDCGKVPRECQNKGYGGTVPFLIITRDTNADDPNFREATNVYEGEGMGSSGSGKSGAFHPVFSGGVLLVVTLLLALLY